MKRTGMVLVLLAGAAVAFAEQEIIVNTVRDSTQRDPQIARDAGGNVVVVWESRDMTPGGPTSTIRLQRLTPDLQPDGTEETVCTAERVRRERPAIAMNAAGDLVVVWASYSGPDSMFDVKGRVYPHGASPGAEFFVNTTMAASQTHPDVAIDAAGGFVVVWDSWYQDGSDRGVYGRRFSADAQPLGPEFLVNSHTPYSQARPAVASWPDGRFVTVWESWRQEGTPASGYGIYGRLWTATGMPDTEEFRVNTTLEDYQWFADVTATDDESFIVAWCSWEQDGDDGGVYVRKFSSSGAALTGEIRANQNTPHYQWLPRLAATGDGGVVVAWSSWKQESDREGVYLRRFSADLNRASFETRANEYTPSFQWEPDCAVLPGGQTVVVWSSWGQTGQDYEVVLRTVNPDWPEGYLERGATRLSAGRTTAGVTIYVVDSTALTGHTYSVRFDTAGRSAVATVTDTVTGQARGTLSMGFGEGMFYISPAFDGVVLQIAPEFDLAIDSVRSKSVLPSGTNIRFDVVAPGPLTRRIAPVDAVVAWGATDTLADGSYATPLDTAINNSGSRVVAVPFIVRNLTEGGKIDLLVTDTDRSGHWDPGERIVLRTPPPYRIQNNNIHAEVYTTRPVGAVVMPWDGDSTFILTTRPITPEDVFLFSTADPVILDAGDGMLQPAGFRLEQNYPNPFNPETRIRFELVEARHTTLKVYDILGREVAVLVDEWTPAGQHEVTFSGSNGSVLGGGSRGLASGVYFYRLSSGDRVMSRKMLLMK